MKEITDIIRAYENAVSDGKKTALATVVKVVGSSYRRPGARMLITEDGQLTGAISGGCLEGDALNKARLAIQDGGKRIVTYDTSDEDDTRSGVGLGCQGIIDILFEPLQPTDPNNPIHLLKDCVGHRENTVLVTIFNVQDRLSVQRGTCFLYRNGQPLINGISDNTIRFKVEDASAGVIKQNQSTIFGLHNNETAFVELLQPCISVIVFGAGNDIAPLVNISKTLGWQTTVIDGRSNYATADRFPGCQVFLSKPEDALSKLYLDNRTAVLLMTHNYLYDLAALRQLAGKPVGYIGSLGPRKKLDLMVEELAGENIVVPLSNLFGPTGLDIGSETPEEIALSIVAEIQAVMTDRNGKPLRLKPSAIHTNAISSKKCL